VNESSRWGSRIPILAWAPRYQRSWLRGDIMAGLIVAALAVPQSLGYAGIAGVPVVMGIYAIPAALIAYAIFGSSPQLVVGPVSTVSVLSGSLVAQLAGGDPARAIAVTSALAIGSGIGLLIGGLLKIGWAAEFLSRPIVTGFVFGLVLVIVIGEIPKLLGLPAPSGDTVERAIRILGSLPDLDPLTALVGVSSLAILFLGAHFAPKIPWGLVVLVGAIVVSSVAGLEERGVDVVGDVPSGLPPIGLPGIEYSLLPAVMFGGLAMALVGLAEGVSAARLFAAKEGYSIDSDQELIGAGTANIAAGLSGGLGVAGSLSKTAAAQNSGGRTQVTGIATALMVLIVLVLFATALAPLPWAVLAAIVIQAVWGLMDSPAIRRYRRIRRNDFVASLAALIGVLLFGPLYGLLIAVLLAMLGLVYRSSRVEVEVMGKVPGEKAAWGSITNHPERTGYEGILVVRLDSPLFWANSADSVDGVIAEVDQVGTGVRAVLLDLEATSQLDTTSIDSLERLLEQLTDRDIDLYLVRVFYSARQTLAKAGFIERLGEERMWHSISAGVRAARKAAREPVDAVVESEASLPPDSERIAADSGTDAPQGGYDDPARADHVKTRRPWWHRR